MKLKALIIAGPTASGKSRLSLTIGRSFAGEIINGDSQQLYRDFPILTACPNKEEQTQIPHHLYQILEPHETCSMGQWREMALNKIQDVNQRGKLAIITGGTGLYLKALLHGISPIPEIPPEIRDQTRALHKEIGNPAFHALLFQKDPLAAAKLNPNDSQRLCRAWEVIETTGKSITLWQQIPSPNLNIPLLLVLPQKSFLDQTIEERFQQMLHSGAIEEAAQLLHSPEDIPARKIIGINQLLDYLEEKIDQKTAIIKAIEATRQYAKRQLTWFRHQLKPGLTLDAQYSESFNQGIFSFIRQELLTPDE